MSLPINSSGLRRVGVAKSKSTAMSPKDVKSGILDGEPNGTRPTFQDFRNFGLLPTSHSYKLAEDEIILIISFKIFSGIL